MSEAIFVALITGGLSLLGVVVTCLATARKNENAMRISQAVTDTKIQELTREVRLHNGFAQRLPDNVMIIISMVVSFYFGTQHERQ